MSLDDVSHIGLLERAAQYRLCLILNVDGRTVRPTISDAFDSFDCWYTSDGMRQQISPPPPPFFFFFFLGKGGCFLPSGEMFGLTELVNHPRFALYVYIL